MHRNVASDCGVPFSLVQSELNYTKEKTRRIKRDGRMCETGVRRDCGAGEKKKNKRDIAVAVCWKLGDRGGVSGDERFEKA